MDFQQRAEMLSQMEANRKAHQAKAESNRIADREETKAHQAKVGANMQQIVADMKAHVQEVVTKSVPSKKGWRP
jgi:hypothetical protein